MVAWFECGKTSHAPRIIWHIWAQYLRFLSVTGGQVDILVTFCAILSEEPL